MDEAGLLLLLLLLLLNVAELDAELGADGTTVTGEYAPLALVTVFNVVA